MSDVLRLQHIATKNALLGVLKARFDYDELIGIGRTIGLLESVKFDDVKSEQASAELAALRARIAELEAANAKARGLIKKWQEEKKDADIGPDADPHDQELNVYIVTMEMCIEELVAALGGEK